MSLLNILKKTLHLDASILFLGELFQITASEFYNYLCVILLD